MRNFLNVLADILTLLAVATSGVGHMFPWFSPAMQHDWRMPSEKKWNHEEELRRQVEFRKQQDERIKELRPQLIEMQTPLAIKSGTSLAVLGFLAAVSLLVNWGPGMRRLLVLLMFASAVSAVVFIAMGFSPYFVTDALMGNYKEDWGFVLALAPACVAAVLCLVRMLWTMKPPRERMLPVKPAVAAAPYAESPRD